MVWVSEAIELAMNSNLSMYFTPGLMEMTFQFNRFFNNGVTTIDESEIPSGIVKPSVNFCIVPRAWLAKPFRFT